MVLAEQDDEWRVGRWLQQAWVDGPSEARSQHWQEVAALLVARF